MSSSPVVGEVSIIGVDRGNEIACHREGQTAFNWSREFVVGDVRNLTERVSRLVGGQAT